MFWALISLATGRQLVLVYLALKGRATGIWSDRDPKSTDTRISTIPLRNLIRRLRSRFASLILALWAWYISRGFFRFFQTPLITLLVPSIMFAIELLHSNQVVADLQFLFQERV